jgi:hypothetical protein
VTSTPDLDIPLIDPNQIGKALTANTAFAAFEGSIAETLTIDAFTNASPYTVPFQTGDAPTADKTALRFVLLKITASTTITAPWTALMPAGKKHFFFCQNLTSQTVTVKVAGQTGIPLTTGLSLLLYLNGTDVQSIGISPVGGTGAVSSVNLSAPAEFSVAGGPITTSGTLILTKANESANSVWAGPVSGSAAQPAFRALVPADYPAFLASGSGHTRGAVPDPGATAGTARFLREDATWVTVAAVVTEPANNVWAGPVSGSAALPTFRALVPADYPTMVASGTGHAGGAVPDPGATSGTTHYLREDGTWDVPPGSGGGGGANAVINSDLSGIVTSGTATINYDGAITVETADAVGAVAAFDITIQAGAADPTQNFLGGSVLIRGGAGGSGFPGGGISLQAGDATGVNTNGGNITIGSGVPTGTGTSTIVFTTAFDEQVIIEGTPGALSWLHLTGSTTNRPILSGISDVSVGPDTDLGLAGTGTGGLYWNNIKLFNSDGTVAFTAGGSGAQTVTTTTATVTPGALGQVNLALQANTTLTIASGTVDGQPLRLRLAQDATGSRTLAFDASVAFGTTIASFTASTAATKVDLVDLLWDATKAKWLFVHAVQGF